MKKGNLTHWRKLTNPKYVGAHDLMPNETPIELNVTIEKVVQEVVKNTNGEEEECTVCYFSGAKKPLILNKTNMNIIRKKLDTPFIEHWSGGVITLYVAKVRAFGEWVDAIRVKAK